MPRMTPAQKARNTLHAALARGDVLRGGCCERCGSQRHLDAHHDDYNRPLAVRWLCRSCHKLHHLEQSGRQRKGKPENRSRKIARLDPLIIECADTEGIPTATLRKWSQRGVPHHFRCFVMSVAERRGLPLPSFERRAA